MNKVSTNQIGSSIKYKLEFVSFGMRNANPPLLFIHGSYCGAWIWERFFLPYFADAGWWGAAISLRGHGKSEGREGLNNFGINDYLEDIEEGMNLLDQDPIIIGHSLGGYMVQKIALGRPLKGQVLLSAPSLLGLGNSAMHVALNNPALGIELLKLVTQGPEVIDQDIINAAFFSSPEGAKEMECYFPFIQKESMRFAMEASFPDMRFAFNSIPTLVLGGDRDAFIPAVDLKYEASFWKADLKILPGVPHAFMIDTTWHRPAREIHSWLNKKICSLQTP